MPNCSTMFQQNGNGTTTVTVQGEGETQTAPQVQQLNLEGHSAANVHGFVTSSTRSQSMPCRNRNRGTSPITSPEPKHIPHPTHRNRAASPNFQTGASQSSTSPNPMTSPPTNPETNPSPEFDAWAANAFGPTGSQTRHCQFNAPSRASASPIPQREPGPTNAWSHYTGTTHHRTPPTTVQPQHYYPQSPGQPHDSSPTPLYIPHYPQQQQQDFQRSPCLWYVLAPNPHS